MNHLLRDLAPISEAGWEALDREGRDRLVPSLAARKLVDFSGPHGWEHSSIGIGRTTPIDPPGELLSAGRRMVQPLVELRADFVIRRDELADVERGALDVDLTGLDEAAQRLARAENGAVFHGWGDAGIVGITEASAFPALALGSDYAHYPGKVARAVETLRGSGVAGPYGLALGPDGYAGVAEATEHGGLLVFDHLREILGGPIVWAPGVLGAVVVSQRGGDYLFESGEDLSIGYSHHDGENVHLYLEESFTFRVASSDAAVVLDP